MIACDIALGLFDVGCPSGIGLPFVVKRADRMAMAVAADDRRSFSAVCPGYSTRLSHYTDSSIRRFLFLRVRGVDSRSDKHHAI
jgi:hypothetical protein